jgi:hypothetical protein
MWASVVLPLADIWSDIFVTIELLQFRRPRLAVLRAVVAGLAGGQRRAGGARDAAP